MTELWLKFTDERGEAKRVSVERETFIVGRHSENDLSFADARLSREHLRIERSGDVFAVSDSGSSNGTTLNAETLSRPVPLKNGDRLNLGGALEIEVEIVSEDAGKEDFSPKDNEFENPNPVDENALISGKPAVESPPETGSASLSATSASNSTSFSVFWLAPVFGLLVLFLVGGLFFAFSGKGEKETARDDDFIYSRNTYSSRKQNSTFDETPTPQRSSTVENSNGNQTASSTLETVNAQTATGISGDAEKIEQSSASFLRQIAQNDPKAFLTGKQIGIVSAKINQFKNSTALAANLKAVKKDWSQFESLASSKNLKPQFLAIAAVAKLGNSSGNPLSIAQTMLPVLSELKITLDNKLADDNLLIIAAYEQGATGKSRALQSVIEALSKKSSNVSPREIRTIWFLRESGKLSETEFEFAIRFLAIGIIAQNPKNFGVNAEPLTL